uniref:Uncharacterized protein n=1 Tax=Naja naja TaxID=35670 RepID=A0A8C6XKY9_NAJNA
MLKSKHLMVKIKISHHAEYIYSFCGKNKMKSHWCLAFWLIAETIGWWHLGRLTMKPAIRR